MARGHLAWEVKFLAAARVVNIDIRPLEEAYFRAIGTYDGDLFPAEAAWSYGGHDFVAICRRGGLSTDSIAD
jgi:hypothetical protein